MDHKNWKIRHLAAKSLGSLKDIRAVEPLIRILKDDSEQFEHLIIQKAAAYSLGEIGDKKAIKPLIEALKSEIQYEAIEALQKIGNAAVEPLIKALDNEHSNIRFNVSLILQDIGDERAIEPLIKTFWDTCPESTLSSIKKFGFTMEQSSYIIMTITNAIRKIINRMVKKTIFSNYKPILVETLSESDPIKFVSRISRILKELKKDK